MAKRLAAEFGIFEPFIVGAVSPRSTEFVYYGMCYSPTRECKSFVIVIRTFSMFDGSDMPSDVVLDTLCHELAHIAFMSHDVRWRRLYHHLLRFAIINNMEV